MAGTGFDLIFIFLARWQTSAHERLMMERVQEIANKARDSEISLLGAVPIRHRPNWCQVVRRACLGRLRRSAKPVPYKNLPFRGRSRLGRNLTLHPDMKHHAKAYVFALLLVVSSCTARRPGTEQSTLPPDQASDRGSIAENATAGPNKKIDFSPVPHKFVGLETFNRGPVSVQVRMAQPADLQNLNLADTGAIIPLMIGTIILVAVPFGAAALPLLGAYAAWGVIFFGGVVPGLYGLEQHRRAVIAEAIAQVDLPRLTQTALERRLEVPAADIDEISDQRVEVVILSYGFAQAPWAEDSACSFLHAQIRLTIPEYATQEDWVFIEPYWRSNDAPPPYCTFANKLFANDGALARQILSESAEILAAIVTNRLKESQ